VLPSIVIVTLSEKSRYAAGRAVFVAFGVVVVVVVVVLVTVVAPEAQATAVNPAIARATESVGIRRVDMSGGSGR